MGHVGKLLKDARIKKGLTQMDVARAMNYSSAQFISNWERDIVDPPAKSFKRIAKILGVTVASLRDAYMRDAEDKLNEMIG
jgi:transcriptional regulator with XRE-family HTH domain